MVQLNATYQTIPIDQYREQYSALTTLEDKLGLLKSQFQHDPFLIDLNMAMPSNASGLLP